MEYTVYLMKHIYSIHQGKKQNKTHSHRMKRWYTLKKKQKKQFSNVTITLQCTIDILQLFS